MRIFPILIILLLSSVSNFAQSERDYDFQYWFDAGGYHRLSDRFSLKTEAGYRAGGDTELLGLRWSSAFLIPSLYFDISRKFSLLGGFGFYYRFRPDLPDNLEMRPWFGVKVNWPQLGPVGFRHLVRIEDRYFRVRGLPDQIHLTRFRYQIRPLIQVYGKPGKAKSLYIPLKYEFFRHFQETRTKKGRLAAGVGYYLNQRFRLEAIYTVDLIRNRQTNDLYRVEHMIRIRFKF